MIQTSILAGEVGWVQPEAYLGTGWSNSLYANDGNFATKKAYRIFNPSDAYTFTWYVKADKTSTLPINAIKHKTQRYVGSETYNVKIVGYTTSSNYTLYNQTMQYNVIVTTYITNRQYKYFVMTITRTDAGDAQKCYIYDFNIYDTTSTGWTHKFNTATISKFNTATFSKWNGLQ